MTTGILRGRVAPRQTSAESSSGASTMPLTPRVMKPSTSLTCVVAVVLAQRAPPDDLHAQLLRRLFGAGVHVLPESCVVPFGMTAMVEFARVGRCGRTRAQERSPKSNRLPNFVSCLSTLFWARGPTPALGPAPLGGAGCPLYLRRGVWRYFNGLLFSTYSSASAGTVNAALGVLPG